MDDGTPPPTQGDAEGQNTVTNPTLENSNFSGIQPSNNPVTYKFCFTLNNPRDKLDDFEADEDDAVREQLVTRWGTGAKDWPSWCCCQAISSFLLRPHLEVVAIGLEKGAEGTEHLQGAFAYNFKKKKRWNAVRTSSILFGDYLVPQKGRGDSAYEYCLKDGSGLFADLRKGAGHRSDLDAAIAAVQETGSMYTIAQEYPAEFVRFHSGLSRLALTLSAPRDAYPKTYWLYGPSGAGKTRTAYESASSDAVWFCPPSLAWFDGYDPYVHKTVVIDDLRANEKTFTFLLRLLDRYPLQVPVKGSFAQWKPDQIFITTPVSPYRMFYGLLRDQDGAFNQLYRRVEESGGHFVRHAKNEPPVVMSLSQMAAEHQGQFETQFAVGFTPPNPQ